MRQRKNKKKSERTSRKGDITGLSCLWGWPEEEEKMERKWGNERTLIRKLKNKIIRLPDSKCQCRKGSRWNEKEKQTHREEEGKSEESKRDRWDWSDGNTITAPFRKKEYNISDAKKQHIARKDIPHLPLEGNRAARSGGWILIWWCIRVCVNVCLYTNTFTAWLGNVALEATLTAASLELSFALIPKSKSIPFSLSCCFITTLWGDRILTVSHNFLLAFLFSCSACIHAEVLEISKGRRMDVTNISN